MGAPGGISVAAVTPKANAGLSGALRDAIRGELAARGMTRAELSRASGVPLDSLKNYLASSPARARVMGVDTVEKIAHSLNMTCAGLIGVAEARRQGTGPWESSNPSAPNCPQGGLGDRIPTSVD